MKTVSANTWFASDIRNKMLISQDISLLEAGTLGSSFLQSLEVISLSGIIKTVVVLLGREDLRIMWETSVR